MKRAIFCLLTPLMLTACGDPADKICDIGDSQRCDCETGPRGFQICAITEDTWTDCSCIPNPTNSQPVTVNGLEMETNPTNMLSWSEAMSLCEANETGGATDWRLPTREELTQSLEGCADQGADLEICDPCANNAWCNDAPPVAYWTSTAAGEGAHIAVHPNDDSMDRAWVQPLPDDYLLPVICVRTP